MEEVLNKSGNFWIENKENIFGGKIIYQSSNFYLECQSFDISSENIIHIPIINGIINDIEVTLYDCYYISSNNNFVFMFKYLFKNFNCDDLSFKKVCLKYFYFNNWIQYSFIGMENLKELLFNYVDPNNFLDLDRFTIALSYNQNNSNIMMPFDFFFELNYYEKTSFDIILNDATILNNFLSILMYGGTNIYEMSFLIENVTGETREVKLFWDNFKSPNNFFNPRNALFSYFDIGDEFMVIIKEWFTNYEKFGPLFYRYFTNTGFNFNAESLFISYTQALESYMRKNDAFDEFYMSEEEYDSFKNKYYEWINEFNFPGDGFKASLNNKIKFGNEYSLRKRIKELLNYFDEYELIDYLVDKYDGFSNIVADTRNYYTHYSEKGPLVKSGGDLVLLCFDLKLLIELCILSELTIKKDLINSKLKFKYNQRTLIQDLMFDEV